MIEVETRFQAPAIASVGDITVVEGERFVAELSASDEDTEATDLSRSIDGGADWDRFVVTWAGRLSFQRGKDFEIPTMRTVTASTR